MTDDFGSRIASLAALDEPARRKLYLFVAAQPEAVSREQAASGCGVPLHTARFHLDRLVDEGLLEVEFRRLTGRSGPGAGRPSKLYRRAEREVTVSLPTRHYELAGDILADAIDRAARDGQSVRQAVAEVAATRGREVGAAVEDPSPSELERTTAALSREGYEPRVTPHGDVDLVNCPFDRLARDHTELVCSMNLAYVAGVLDGLHCDSLEAVLDPEPGLCCVKARGR